MRTRNSLINSIFGLIYRLSFLGSAFFVRMILSRNFSADYLGLEGLFANVIGVFSLVDMGLGTAISFSLYKPIYENDRNTINAIMKLYQKVYIGIGILIAFLSLVFTPVLPYLIKDNGLNARYIQICFLIYALGIAVTYFFSYNRTLLFAFQQNYIALTVDTIVKLICVGLQIFSIVKLHNFYIYLACTVFANVVANFIITKIVIMQKKYDVKNECKLPDEYLVNLKMQVKALAITNVSGMAITSTDNILISSIVGNMSLAINSNYSMITQAIRSIFTAVLDGARAPIGDLIAEGNVNKIRDNFLRYTFSYFWAGSLSCVGFYYCSKPLVELWVGNIYLYSDLINAVISINLFLILSMQGIVVFQNMAGLYTIYQPIVVTAAIINLVVSIVLGLWIGTIGIFIGTAVSYCYQTLRFCTLLHSRLLKCPSDSFWKLYYKFIILTLICAFLTLVFELCLDTSGFIKLVLVGLFVLVIHSLILFLIFRNDSSFNYYRSLIERVIKKVIGCKMKEE